MLLRRYHQKAEETVDIGGLKVAELKAYASEHGIDLGEATKKADIVAAITAAEAEQDSESPADDEPTGESGD